MEQKCNENIKYSIIIPVYNAKKYLKKCLNSVVKQRYSNYEVIVVDDGSTDGSDLIIDKYSRNYEKIHAIKQENQGPSLARINGINASTGDYILFLDADDWYEPELLVTVNEIICSNNVSFVQFSYNKIRYGLSHKAITGKNKCVKYKRENLKNYIYCAESITYQLWDKAYPRELIREAALNADCSLRIGEDAYLNFMMLFENPEIDIYYSDCCLYNYRQGSGITSSQDIKSNYTRVMEMKKAMYDFLVRNGCSNDETVKAIFVDTSMMTRYYAYRLIEKYSASEKTEDLINEVIFKNPMIKETAEYFKKYETDVEACKALTYSVDEYIDYLKKNEQEYIDGLTKYQKLCRMISLFKRK